MDGKAVADRLTNTCEAEQREQREAMERSLTRDEERIEVLDKMVMRLYEDMIAGRISEQNFNTMLEKTQTEQTELKTKVSEGRKRLSDEVQLANDAKQWVEAIQEYANITELDAATLNRLIKEIVVHERIDEIKQDTFLSKFILISNPSRRWNRSLPDLSRRTVLLKTPYRFFVRRRPPSSRVLHLIGDKTAHGGRRCRSDRSSAYPSAVRAVQLSVTRCPFFQKGADIWTLSSTQSLNG